MLTGLGEERPRIEQKSSGLGYCSHVGPNGEETCKKVREWAMNLEIAPCTRWDQVG